MSDVAITDRILVQRADFSLADEYARLAARQDTGAIVSFVGKVRDFNQGEQVKGLALEHYPGMTEKALAGIVAEARSRWPSRIGCISAPCASSRARPGWRWRRSPPPRWRP